MPVELPSGRYLSCAFGVSPDAAGQTRALLMRNRFLASEGGVRPSVLAFGGAPDYDERRRVLLERGLLSEHVELLNIYDHYREHGWGDEPPTGEPLPDLSARRVGEEARADGTPWRISYRLPDSGRLVYDYLRADGTPFLRIPRYGVAERASWRCTIHRLGSDGAPVGAFGSVGQWFRHWIRELAEGHERAFVFIDSRFVIPHVVPLRRRGIHVLYQMHNMHLEPPRRWDSALHPVYRRVLARIDDLDALVNLTERQRDDIAAAPRPDDEHVRRSQPRRRARAARAAAGARPEPGDDHGAAGDPEAPAARDLRLRARGRGGAGGAARHLRRGQPAGQAPDRDRAIGPGRRRHAARLRPRQPARRCGARARS